MASIEVDEFLARWLMPNDFKPVVGHAFTFRTEPVPQHGFDGIAACEVLELEAPRLMILGGGWRGHLVRRLGALLEADAG
jgi:uncharacterized protein YndB with AHSA1/START domain